MEEGRKEGREEGIAKGRERVNKLNAILIKAGRYDDLSKSTSDEEFQKKLFEEFNL